MFVPMQSSILWATSCEPTGHAESEAPHDALRATANLNPKILDFRGFDSGRILIVRVEIPRRIAKFRGNFESRNLNLDN